MGGYFKPWRRKLGVVTLVMACVFAVGWVRSFRICDNIGISNGDRSYHQLFSCPNWFGWVMVPCTKGTIPNWYQTSVHGWHTSNLDHRMREESPYSMVHLHMEAKGRGYNWRYSDVSNPHFIVPYPSVVITLTLISFWLLLSKPKTSTTKKIP